MKPNYNDSKERLAEMLKNNQAKTPVQEVRPVVVKSEQPKDQPKEVHVNFWADAGLIDRVKLHALQNRTTIKQVCQDALEAYLSSQSKQLSI
jgi:hypothetical protein